MVSLLVRKAVKWLGWAWVKARLREKSTWFGIFWVLGLAGIYINPEYKDALAILLSEVMQGDYLDWDLWVNGFSILMALIGGKLIVQEEGSKGEEKKAPPPPLTEQQKQRLERRKKRARQRRRRRGY